MTEPTAAPLALDLSDHADWLDPQGSLSVSKVRSFAESDWDFVGHSSRDALHPYPAKFIDQLPLRAFEIFDGDAVLDPFCGSGTSLEIAASKGMGATGVDLNPIACLISRVRLSTWNPGDIDAYLEHLEGLRVSCLEIGDDEVAERVSRIPRVEHWFEAWAQRLLAGATKYVASIEDPTWRDRVALSVSSTVVRLSRQESDTRYAAVEKRGDFRTGLLLLEKSLTKTANYLSKRDALPMTPTAVHQADARDLRFLDDETHDVALFSPPYPNAYEYWLYHKYRMYWLDHNPIAVREEELGARPHYSKKNGLTEEDFGQQMKEVFAELARVLRRGSATMIVVGDSLIGGRVIDNRALIFDMAGGSGFRPRAATIRTLHRPRSSFNSAHGAGRDFEHVLLLERS